MKHILTFLLALTTSLSAWAQTQEAVLVGGRPATSYLPVPQSTEANRLPVDPETGTYVGEVADGLFVVTDGVWQSAFLLTDSGVVVFDAPMSYGTKIPDLIATQTSAPVTHLVYSHAHKDHIGGTPALIERWPELEIVAHETVASYLLDLSDPNRPLPTHTFAGSLTLNVGGQRIELDEIGPYHSAEADLFISFPRQRVLYAIDSVTPGWVTFQGLDLTVNTHNYLRVGKELMARDWDIFIGGHLTQLGTREQVAESVAYTEDVLNVATEVFTSTDMLATMGEAATQAGWSNPFLLFRHYQDTMVAACTERVVQRWGQRLAGVDVYAPSHCDRLLAYLRVD